MKKSNWYRLDNSAKIMPSTTTIFNTNVFRLYCNMKEDVDKKILQESLDKTLIEFPMFLYSMKDGLFWHYLEESNYKPIVKEECEFAIKQAIIASGELGGKWCALHPRSSITSGFSVKKALEDNRRDFFGYLELAKKHNTGLAAENLPIFPGLSPSMPFYSSDYYDLCELVDSFNDSSMAICWDTGHAHLMHFDQAEAIKFLGRRIKCTHIHNNDRREDKHFPPDNGSIEWDKVMAAFASFGYDGPLTLETHCLYPTEDLLKNFARHNYGCLEYLEKLGR